MIEPTFFLDDDWTGYGFMSSEALIFDGIGGDNADVTINRVDQLPNSEFTFRVEQSIRFHLLLQSEDGDKFTLQSNCFHSHASIEMLRIKVNKEMGHLVIAHRYPLIAYIGWRRTRL
jgi:hypothetical protein